ncbi:hypothetical protein JL36_01950 [Lactococcus cremoris]|jgi:hypothetical protein|nr:hypothetical protein JL36_01950 [Lactococcus cremoris]
MINVSIFVIVGSLLAILCYFVNIQLMEELKRFSLFFRVAGTIYFISNLWFMGFYINSSTNTWRWVWSNVLTASFTTCTGLVAMFVPLLFSIVALYLLIHLREKHRSVNYFMILLVEVVSLVLIWMILYDFRVGM